MPRSCFANFLMNKGDALKGLIWLTMRVKIRHGHFMTKQYDNTSRLLAKPP